MLVIYKVLENIWKEINFHFKSEAKHTPTQRDSDDTASVPCRLTGEKMPPGILNQVNCFFCNFRQLELYPQRLFSSFQVHLYLEQISAATHECEITVGSLKKKA